MHIMALGKQTLHSSCDLQRKGWDHSRESQFDQGWLDSKLCIHPGGTAPAARAPPGSGARAHPWGCRLVVLPASPLPARVPTSLVLIGGCMQTPVVSSFMGRESGGEQREWAQWGALAGSACSRGEERRGGRGGERGEEEIREGKERKIAQCKMDLSTPDCSPASLTHSLLPASGHLTSGPSRFPPLSAFSSPPRPSLVFSTVWAEGPIKTLFPGLAGGGYLLCPYRTGMLLRMLKRCPGQARKSSDELVKPAMGAKRAMATRLSVCLP